MRRIVVRPWIQVSVLTGAFGVFGLIGVGMFLDGQTVAERDWFGIAIGTMCLLLGVVGLWRTARLGMVMDERAVRVRGLDSRDRVIAWNEIESIECVQVDERMGLPIFAPVLVLGRDKGALPVPALGSYKREGAERKAERLRALKTAAAARDEIGAAVPATE